MTQKACPFVWHELMTTDDKAAQSFYQKVVGWSLEDAGMKDMTYTMLVAGGTRIGGIFTLSPEMVAAGARPGWMGYIGVDDVAAYAERVVAKGGKMHRPPAPIPGVGMFAIVADPHGAVFTLFTGTDGQMPPAGEPGAIGHVGWNELHAGDGVAAFAFYSEIFGWTKSDTMDMGPMGVYQLFAAGGPPIGGMMTKMPQSPVPFWLFYFNVDGIDAALARATEAGAQLIHGPSEVPGGSWIVNCIDPQGAIFAMVSAKR